MTVYGVCLGLVTLLVVLIFAIALPAVEAQSSAPAPAPAPTRDGATIDQAIAYVLMLVALLPTYLIHQT